MCLLFPSALSFCSLILSPCNQTPPCPFFFGISRKKRGKKSVALSLFNFASAALPHLTWGFMLLSSHLKLCAHSLSNQQILVIMSDATEKHKWLIYYFWESRDVSFFSVGKCFPCVVASLMFERRFYSGGLCFLTSGSGIFRCWLWIISCNDGSAWHVCLDSMPSSLHTDQTELSYWLQIEADIAMKIFKLSFIHTFMQKRTPCSLY